MTDLLSCPFCGIKPIGATHGDFKHPLDFTTEHDDDICPLNGLNFDHSQRLSWNKRIKK